MMLVREAGGDTMRSCLIIFALMYAACQGERGPAGEDGEDGLDGEDGETGPQGAMGEQGAMGLPGAPGSEGAEGPPGAKGADGARGAPGPAGMNGTSSGAGSTYRPAAFVGCAVLLDLLDGIQSGEDGDGDTILTYNVTIFSNDDLEVRCAVELLGVGSDSTSEYYPSVTVGATTGPCLVTADLPPYPQGASAPGYWRMTIAPPSLSAAYHDVDPGHPRDGDGYTFIEDDCNAFVMDLGGTWHPSMLTDVF
jgi:hypothetical protein